MQLVSVYKAVAPGSVAHSAQRHGWPVRAALRAWDDVVTVACWLSAEWAKVRLD